MPLLRVRSDEQLVRLFRSGHDEAFRAIHDRYHQRLFAYTRQMLPRHHDAEDALQDVFVRVYTNLRASERGAVTLKPWLYRAAHNRCIDELRRPAQPTGEVTEDVRSPSSDPAVELVEREAFGCVLEDIRRLPVQQRSALLQRELGGAQYSEIALALGTTVPAVKSLLVRARVTLGAALEARNTDCSTIREDLALAQDSGERPNATARAHVRDCAGCREFGKSLRGTSRQLAGLVPTLGPLGLLAKTLGFGSGGGAVAAGGGGAIVPLGVLSGGHLATLVAAAALTAGGAVELQSALVGSSRSAGDAPPAVSSPPPSFAHVNRRSATRPAVPPAVHPRKTTTTPAPATHSSVSTKVYVAPTSTAGATPARRPATTGSAAVRKPDSGKSGTSAPPSGTVGQGSGSITGAANVTAPGQTALQPSAVGSASTTAPASSSSGSTATGDGAHGGATSGTSQTTSSNPSPSSARTTSSS